MFNEEEMEIGEDERRDHRKDAALDEAGYCPECGKLECECEEEEDEEGEDAEV